MWKGKATPEQELRAPEGWGSRISRQSALGGGKVGPTHRPPSAPRRYLWYSCLSKSESTLGPYSSRKEYVNEKFSDIIENRTRDLPACSAVHQPTAPVGVPKRKVYQVYFKRWTRPSVIFLLSRTLLASKFDTATTEWSRLTGSSLISDSYSTNIQLGR